MALRQHISHGIPPTYDGRSRVLVLGTMPSPASRELGFNYGHPRNRFWRVMAHLAGEPVPATNERKRDFCLRHHIALWDVLAECDIEGASDASIRNARPNPLTRITDAAPIEAVFCTGAKAHELYCKLCEADVGIPAVKLPSTSPANAACGFDELARAYAQVLEHERAFEPPVMDVADVVALEQAIAACGTPLSELMDRAGAAVAWRVRGILDELARGAYAREVLPGDARRPPQVAVLCGNGNNGGDGWVAAALLAQAGVGVSVIAQRHPDDLVAQPAHDAAVRALQALVGCGAVLAGPADGVFPDADGFPAHAPAVLVGGTDEQCRALIRGAQVVVDAILGTGASKAPRAPFDGWIAEANRSRASHVQLAVDVPSGVSAQTGQVSAPCFLADETLTMMVRKPGLAAAECGHVRIAPLAYLEPFLETR